jgi:hypothetical protein
MSRRCGDGRQYRAYGWFLQKDHGSGGGSMPGELGIERSLKRAAKSTGQPLFEKYVVLKDRRFKQELGYWAAKFPGGNDHGPQHV